MSTYVLDTCALIDLDDLDLGRYQEDVPTITAITIGELAFGVDLGDSVQRGERAELLQDTLIKYEVLPYGVEAAKLYGVLATLIRVAGRNPRPRRLDLQIAATAAAARFPLLTTNPDDFRGLERLVTVIPLNRAR